MKVKYKRESGQALVLILLFLAVVLTLVLFILSRSITGIAVSSGSEEAIRAFSAAEAGIEKALVIGAGGTNISIGNATYSSSVTSVAEGANNYIYPLTLTSGDSATVWFVAHDSANNDDLTCGAGSPCFIGRTVKVCWGNPGTSASASTTPAVEMSVFYETTPGDLATIKIARAAFDPYTTRVSSDTPAKPNSFSAPDAGTCTIGSETYEFQKEIDLSTLGIPAGSYNTQNGLQFMRLRIFYNTDVAHKIGFDVNFAGNTVLPSQGSQIDSTGTAGQSNRRLSVFQGWPEPPSVFDFAIYSSTGITK
ncbi:MAG: pilus assembly PilX N-terminal domain-containing protein [Candidatus Woesebacteria bacterium]|nr:MAG: pilus assembly PilX N-terminal domain-containing protein [Candidatus Woesebacteria bacterium]